MCKEMPVITADRAVDKKRIIGKNGEPRGRRGTLVADPPPQPTKHLKAYLHEQ
jgi:hypothetical protein